MNGARVVSAVVVLFHHIGSLDEDLWDPEELAQRQGADEDDGSRLRLLGASSANQDNLFDHLINVGPGHVAVEVFLVVAGFVAAHDVWVRLGERARKQASESFGAFELRVGGALFKRHQAGLLRRFWRLALPLVPVHIVHLVLWRHELAYGQYLTFPSTQSVNAGYSVGVPAIWASVLSGSLWILEALFLAPFVALAVQLPAQNLRPAARAVWYGCAAAYFAGNLFESATVSTNLSVVLGVALADYYNHEDAAGMPALRAGAQMLLALALVSLTWWPDPFYSHRASMISSAAGFVYVCLYAPRLFQRLLDNALMARAAKYAYELYIWHLVVLSAFAVNVQPSASKPVLYIFGFGACLAWAVLAYYIFEVPSNWIGDRIVEWFLRDPDRPERERRRSLRPASGAANGPPPISIVALGEGDGDELDELERGGANTSESTSKTKSKPRQQRRRSKGSIGKDNTDKDDIVVASPPHSEGHRSHFDDTDDTDDDDDVSVPISEDSQ